MSFDLEVSGTQHNGSCYPINEGSIVLSYRIGTSRQWKIIEEYSSVGKQELCSKSYLSLYICMVIEDNFLTITILWYIIWYSSATTLHMLLSDLLTLAKVTRVMCFISCT